MIGEKPKSKEDFSYDENGSSLLSRKRSVGKSGHNEQSQREGPLWKIEQYKEKIGKTPPDQ